MQPQNSHTRSSMSNSMKSSSQSLCQRTTEKGARANFIAPSRNPLELPLRCFVGQCEQAIDISLVSTQGFLKTLFRLLIFASEQLHFRATSVRLHKVEDDFDR